MHFEFVTQLGDAVARCTIPINLGRVKISDFPMIDVGVDGGVTAKPLTIQTPPTPTPTPAEKCGQLVKQKTFSAALSAACSGQKLPTYVVLAGTAN